MELRKLSFIFLTWTSTLVLIIAALVVAPSWQRRGARALSGFDGLTTLTANAAEVNPWTQAVEKVKEDRGEPVGKQAKIEIPSELRHYSDTRRFLAVQVAEVKQHDVATPQDLVDLAGMIASGQFIQLKPVNENYILFGVGGHADRQPFTRYENGKSIPLYNEAELQAEYKRLADSEATANSTIADIRKQLADLKPRGKSKRARLQSSAAKELQARLNLAEKARNQNREAKALLDRQYGNAEARKRHFEARESVARLAAEKFKSPNGSTPDLGEGPARQRLKVQILSSLRPEAAKVLEEIASSYREAFDRPLPITSLVRPDEYQHQLSKTNPNATRIETPPHSTGLAFDILYRYMTAAEQSHVMSHLARLKDEGRIEVLRENRDHYHVFAFVDGARPGENFIAASLGNARPATRAAKPDKQLAHHSRKKATNRKNESGGTRSKARTQNRRSKTTRRR